MVRVFQLTFLHCPMCSTLVFAFLSLAFAAEPHCSKEQPHGPSLLQVKVNSGAQRTSGDEIEASRDLLVEGGVNASTGPILLDVSKQEDVVSARGAVCGLSRRRGCGRPGYSGPSLCPCGQSEEFWCTASDGAKTRFWHDGEGRCKRCGDDCHDCEPQGEACPKPNHRCSRAGRVCARMSGASNGFCCVYN